MKRLLMVLFLTPFLTFTTQGGDGTIGSLPGKGGDTTLGDKGVKNGTCWERDGVKARIGVVGTIHGDQKVTATSGGDTGSGTGTPASDGGCRESGLMTAGGNDFRVKNGKPQMKGDDGEWDTMTATDDPCEDDDGTGG